jgi:L-threonylcarbamoyladenylate synthase
VKHRPPERAIPLIAADRAQVEAALGRLSPAGERLAARYWPGPLTLLMPAAAALALAVSSETGRVGVRVPAHEVARGLCRACGTLLTATSANVSGEAPTNNPDDVVRSLTDLDALIDAGRTPGGQPSTIVDVRGEHLTLVRAGAISWDAVQACLGG